MGGEWLLLVLPILWVAVVVAGCTAVGRRRLPPARPADWRAAEARARALLYELLPPDQARRVLARGYLDLPSPRHPRRRYRIFRGARPTQLFEDGRLVAGICLVPRHYLPPTDGLILEKLLIEADEEAYLRQGNYTRIWRTAFPLPGWGRARAQQG